MLTLFKILSIGMAACMIERETLSMNFQRAYADFTEVKYGNGRHAALLELDNFIGILKVILVRHLFAVHPHLTIIIVSLPQHIGLLHGHHPYEN